MVISGFLGYFLVILYSVFSRVGDGEDTVFVVLSRALVG